MSKHRLQLDFTGKALEDLDSLKETTELPNRAEVIRQALRLLQWTIQETQTKKGTLLLELNDGRQREIVFPFWSPQQATKVTADG
jgi:Arc/MetJ-type ribon-helix-helix transcriptional regulator